MTTSNRDSLFNNHFIIKGIAVLQLDEYGVPLSWQDAQQKYSLLFFISMDLLRVSQRLGKMSSLGNNKNEHCTITSKIAYHRLLKPITKRQLLRML